MKVFIDKKNYIDIKPDKATGSVTLAIKAKKDDKHAVLVTVKLTEEQAEKIISNLVTAKAKL